MLLHTTLTLLTLQVLHIHLALPAPSPLICGKHDNILPITFPWNERCEITPVLANNLHEFVTALQHLHHGNLYQMGVTEHVPEADICHLCEVAVDAIKHLATSGSSEEQFAAGLLHLCEESKLEPDFICQGLITAYSPDLYYILNNSNTSTSTMCAVIMQRSTDNCTTDDPSIEWTVDVDVGPKPPHIEPVLPPDGSPVMKVLHLSDFHYDDNYTVGSAVACPYALCCRSDSGPGETPGNSAGYWGSYGYCDIPERTLINTLENIKKEHGQELDYIIMTGDIPAHNIWETSREASVQKLQHVYDLLHTYFPNSVVYPTLGNHEPHPANSYPYQEVPDKQFNPSWLYNAAADAWSRWLPEDALNTVRFGGFYMAEVMPGLRIISLNTNFCSVENYWMLYDSHDPENQLEWLAMQLLDAEKTGWKVHIIGHIAPGDVSCWKIWSREFSKLLFRFEDTVVAHFYAHVHFEEVRLSYDPTNDTRATNVMYLGGSVTTYPYLNPGYTIYEIDAPSPYSTYMVLDFSTYVFNMTKANIEGEPRWYHLLSAKKDFGLENLLPREWNRFVHEMARDPATFDSFYRISTKDSDFFAARPCDLPCRQKNLCQLVTVDNSNMTYCKEIESEVRIRPHEAQKHNLLQADNN